jgi:phage terminase Nu1 subunit (DNA packaging protein)
MAKGKGQKVNRKQLADVFGVSLPTIDAWLRAGCPFEQKGAAGKEWIFDTADVSRWREQRAADEAGGTDVQDDAALKRRKLRAETMSAELDLLQKKGLVAPVDQVERVLSRALAEVQSNLRGSLVTRLVAQLLGETDDRAFKRIALAEIDAVLESLADIDVTDEEASAEEEPAVDDA